MKKLRLPLSTHVTTFNKVTGAESEFDVARQLIFGGDDDSVVTKVKFKLPVTGSSKPMYALVRIPDGKFILFASRLSVYNKMTFGNADKNKQDRIRPYFEDVYSDMKQMVQDCTAHISMEHPGCRGAVPKLVVVEEITNSILTFIQ